MTEVKLADEQGIPEIDEQVLRTPEVQKAFADICDKYGISELFVAAFGEKPNGEVQFASAALGRGDRRAHRFKDSVETLLLNGVLCAGCGQLHRVTLIGASSSGETKLDEHTEEARHATKH